MTRRVHFSDRLIYSAGSQVVIRKPVQGSNERVAQPAGAVGVIVKSPLDQQHAYRIRFTDGSESQIRHENLTLLAQFKEGDIAKSDVGRILVDVNDESQLAGLNAEPLMKRVIFRCVIGSRAYGLDDEESDVDRRGVYLPAATQHWSLYGVPEQIENEATQEAYWELQKFIVLALKANPNVLECLYSPIVETATPLAEELLGMKEVFMSRLVYQTYNGYVMSQFKKMQADIRNQGQVKWKHVMHLIRLLISGIKVLNEGFVPVRVDEHRDALLRIKAGEMPWDDVEAWRLKLHADFNDAFEKTTLPLRPDYEAANSFLVNARQLAMQDELP
jgi:hypothetical protein